MARSLGDAVAAARAAFRARTALIMEVIALRHQVAVLQRNRTRRPCFRASDRLLWVLLSRWWHGWRESLIIVQSETVLRWRRQGLLLIRDVDRVVVGVAGAHGSPARYAA